MPLRFEAWTLPSSGSFIKKFDIPALAGSAGVRELSAYSDEAIHVQAPYPKLDQLVSETIGSLIRVYSGATVIDEFDAARVSRSAGRPNTFTISGPQRNGLVEGIAIAPWNYPNHVAQAMDHVYGGKSMIPSLALADLGSIREEYELYLSGEAYGLDLQSATSGDFVLELPGGDTAPIDVDASGSSIKSAIEAVSGITEVFVDRFEDNTVKIVFESPKGLASDMTIDDSGVTGSATLTFQNNGFDPGLDPTMTMTVDGDTTETLPWDASANQIQGLSESIGTPAGLQGLTTVDDVAVSGAGTYADPWVITFYAPPAIGAFSVTFAAGTAILTQITEGALDPHPVTFSKPIDAGVGPDDAHGTYGAPRPIEVVLDNLDTGADWALLVRALTRYAGSQIVLSVVAGQTYSGISVRVKPTVAGDYTIVLRDEFGNLLAESRDNPLSAGSYQTLTLPTLVMRDGVTQAILRVAVTDADPSNIDDFYVNWQGATFFEGQPQATWTKILADFLGYAVARGAGEWLELDATETADSLGTTLDEISFTQYAGDDTHLGHALDQGKRMGYQWRLVPAAEALIIMPAGTTSHVLQTFYINADEIEDLTAGIGGDAGPTITVGAKGVADAQVVTRRIPFTTLIGLGSGSLSLEDANATAEAGLGRIERIKDVEHLASAPSVQEFLDAQFAEQNLNLRAANATVLETATKVPFIHYSEGSKIWWQFPGMLTKEARPVKRIGWTHDNTATFEIQGSRVLTGDAALAAAVDHLLRQPGRRRSQPAPVAVTGGGGGGVPRITMAAANASLRSKAKADPDFVATTSRAANLDMFLRALAEMDDILGGEIRVTEGNLDMANPGADIQIPSRVVISGAGEGVTFIRFEIPEPTIRWAQGSGFRYVTWGVISCGG